jgi:hypothetical protein
MHQTMLIHLEFVLIIQHWPNSECVESLESSSRLNQLIITGVHLKQRHTPISQLMYQNCSPCYLSMTCTRFKRIWEGLEYKETKCVLPLVFYYKRFDFSNKESL